MLVKRLLGLCFLIGVLFLSGCGDTLTKTALTGLIDHPHQMTLGDGMTVIVRIEDTTRSGAPGKKIAEEIIKAQGDTIPMPFAIVYDPRKINTEHKYSISVKIQDAEGNVIYVNQANIPVITQGNPTHDIDVVVVLAGG